MLLLLLFQVLHPVHLLRVAPQGKHNRFPAAIGLRAAHLQMCSQRVAQLKQGPFLQFRVALGRKCIEHIVHRKIHVIPGRAAGVTAGLTAQILQKGTALVLHHRNGRTADMAQVAADEAGVCVFVVIQPVNLQLKRRMIQPGGNLLQRLPQRGFQHCALQPEDFLRRLNGTAGQPRFAFGWVTVSSIVG